MRDLGPEMEREEEGGSQSNMQEITREFSASSVPSLSLKRSSFFQGSNSEIVFFSVQSQEFLNFF